MQVAKRQKIILLTLVHPDFLPPVYATAQSLRDLNYDIHILTFDSFVPAPIELGPNIVVEAVGKFNNSPFLHRMGLKRKFARRASELVSEKPVVLITFCPFSYTTALSVKKNIPVIYSALEIADFHWKKMWHSPFSYINNLQTFNSLDKASIVATPSIQRSAWLAGRCHTNFLPYTIYNTSYLPLAPEADTKTIFSAIVPAHFLDKKIVLYTGAVNDRLCVFELVRAFDLINDNETALILTGIKDNQYCNSIKSFVEKSKYKNNILLLPYVSRTEMLALQANAHIGACLSREDKMDIASKMVAPNKVGEYLMKGLYILGIRGEYMDMFETNGVASMASTTSDADVSIALIRALAAIENPEHKEKINSFVRDHFCMQKQIKPIIDFLMGIGE